MMNRVLLTTAGSSWSSQATTKLGFLAFSLRPSRLCGESAVPHSPPRREERKESANKNSFQAAKHLRLSSMEWGPAGQPRVSALYQGRGKIRNFLKMTDDQ